MKKFNLLLLDADVIFELFRQRIWDNIVASCDIHLAETIVDEAKYYYDENDVMHPIDLKQYSDEGKISIFAISATDIDKFRTSFDPIYLEKMDSGETESLVHLMNLSPDARMCSADKIVFRVLGNIDMSSQGISLEEIIMPLGLGRDLKRQFRREYREEWTNKGVEERLYGIGRMKK